MAEQACWRCGRTDTERIKATVQTVEMRKAGVVEQCKDTLACISESMGAAHKALKDGDFGVAS